MEMDLNNLIKKIQKDGVDQAQTKSEQIIKNAEIQAASIIEKAKKQGEELLSASKAQADQYQEASINTIKQASRDVLLTLRARVQEFFSRIVKEEVAKNLSTDLVKEAILKIADKFSPDQDIEVLLTEKEKDELKTVLIKALKARNATIKGTAKIEKGFRIGEKGTNAFFDFSDEAITESFVSFLNPKLVKQLDIDLGIGEEGEDA